MMIPLVSFFPHPPPSMFSLLNYSIILKLLHYFGKLLLFVTTLQPISHFKFEFFLPSSNLLVLHFYPPPKHYGRPNNQDNSGAAAVKRKPKQGRSQRESGRGGGGLEQPPNEMTLSTGVYGSLWRASSLSPGQPPPPPPPLAPPHFEKAGYAPANETAQKIIEFEHGLKKQLLSRSTIFMVYLLYITCKALIWKNALICNSRFHLGIDSM